MRVFGYPRVFYQAVRHQAPDLSRDAQERLRYLGLWETLRGHGLSSTDASEQLGIPRATLYRWKQRLKRGLRELEERSRRPRRLRQAQWDPALVEEVRRLREEWGWGKDKLAAKLRKGGQAVSPSKVGRVLSRLKQRGALQEPLIRRSWPTKRRVRRPYAIRKPRGYAVSQPGDLVQVDTVDLRPLPGVVLKQFTARDVVCRWDILAVRSRATAGTATEFLDALRMRMPFPVHAIQVDGGSEFMAEFEEACRTHRIQLFVLPPHSPKLNGHVERANRTHQEEFWQRYEGDLDLPIAQPALLAWEQAYNTVRPHQALGYLTPAQFLAAHFPALAVTDPHTSEVKGSPL